MSLYEEYLYLLDRKKSIDAAILAKQVDIYNQFKMELDNKPKGTFNFESSGFKVKIVKKETIIVDQRLASVVEVGFRKKYELDAKEYKGLSDEDKRRVEECITTKPGKPSFTVERIEDGN